MLEKANKIYCQGTDTNLKIEELEGKAWHDNDLYLITCSKCGVVEEQLCRRPSQVIIRCKK